MEWNEGDYTTMYSDAFVAPEDPDASGIYLLESARRLPRAPGGPPLRADGQYSHRNDREHFTSSDPGRGFRGLTSSRRDRPEIEAAGWDERPQHYRPDADNAHAHLFIPAVLRPPQGGHNFNEAYPVLTPSHAVDQIDRFAGGPGPACPGIAKVEFGLQVVKVVLLFIIVVLLGIWVALSASQRRSERDVKDAVREALASLRGTA